MFSSSFATNYENKTSSASPESASSSTPNQAQNQDQPQAPDQLKAIFGTFCKQQLLQEVEKLKTAVQKEDPQQVIMAVPMLLALTVLPGMMGTQEAIRQSQSKTKREEHRSRRCNLVVSCVKPSIRSRDINNKLVVLKDNKLFIANEHPLYNHDRSSAVSKGYPFSGYFLPYPDAQYEGLVSTIQDEPPQLNWIYVDKDTYEVKYGLRVEAQPHITGPFDCTKQDRRMTVEGWEGFCAVEELPGIWALYYDRDDNGLKNKVAMGTRVLEVELTRREKKERKPAPSDQEQAMTLDEKMKQHKEQSAQEEKEKAAFAESGNLQDAPQPVPNHIADAHQEQAEQLEEKAEMLRKAMGRLGLQPQLNLQVQPQNKAEDEKQETQSQHSRAPSATTTADFSLFSAPHQANETTGDGGSVTVASSVCGRESSDVNDSDDSAYKKPYVEDDK